MLQQMQADDDIDEVRGQVAITIQVTKHRFSDSDISIAHPETFSIAYWSHRWYIAG
jgi:hypothetical protein